MDKDFNRYLDVFFNSLSRSYYFTENEKTESMLNEMGVSIRDDEGKIKSFFDILDDLESK